VVGVTDEMEKWWSFEMMQPIPQSRAFALTIPTIDLCEILTSLIASCTAKWLSFLQSHYFYCFPES
jgi:hypothetical protein